MRADLNVLTPFNRCKLTIQKNDATHQYIKYIVYCAQSHTYQQRDDRKHKMSAVNTRVTETTKPTHLAKKCGFKVNLFFDLKSFQWYMKVANNITHTHHYPTEIENFKFERKHLTTTMQNELKKLNNGNTSTTIQSNILMTNNDIVLGRHTLYNKKVANYNDELCKMTDCEQLLHALENEKNVTYFALFGESINSSLLTIPIVKKAKQVKKNQQHAEVLTREYQAQVSQIPLLQRLQTERQEKYAQAYRSNLVGTQSRTFVPASTNINYYAAPPSLSVRPKHVCHNDIHINGIITNTQSSLSLPPVKTKFKTQLDAAETKLLKDIIVKESDGLLNQNGEIKVLLACGWARNDDIAVLRKFPEVLHMDTTFKTNKEGRPLFNIVVKDSNNQLRTVFRCILPSEKQCIFDTILCSVLPNILGKETCQRVQYIVTDGDSQEINAVQNACKNIFPNAVQNTCLWHMIIHGVNAKSKITNDRLTKVLRSWLWYTASNAETHEERKELVAHLKV